MYWNPSLVNLSFSSAVRLALAVKSYPYSSSASALYVYSAAADLDPSLASSVVNNQANENSPQVD